MEEEKKRQKEERKKEHTKRRSLQSLQHDAVKRTMEFERQVSYSTVEGRQGQYSTSHTLGSTYYQRSETVDLYNLHVCYCI